MIKIASLASVTDTGRFRRALAKFLGRQQEVQLLSVYGIVYSPPPGSQLVLWPMMGDESNQIGIADAQPIRPIKDLKPGEVALANYLTGDCVYMREDGTVLVQSAKKVEVEAPDVVLRASAAVRIEAPLTQLTGDVDVGGTLTVGGVPMNTHAHTDPQGGVTGPPQ